jgi:hypothetical protein
MKKPTRTSDERVKSKPELYWTRKDKDRKGEEITRIVSSYTNEAGKQRQKHILSWGKLPTIQLEKILSDYNKATQSGRTSEANKIWMKIETLREHLRKMRALEKRWLKKSLIPENNPYSLFLNSVENLKRDFEKVLRVQALDDVDKKEAHRLQLFLDETKWFAELRTHIRHKMKRMIPQWKIPTTPFADFISKTMKSDLALRTLDAQTNKPIDQWPEAWLRHIKDTTERMAERHALVKRLLGKKEQ